MAIILTVQSIVSSGNGIVLVTASRSDGQKSEIINVDISSAATALAALNLVSAAVTIRASQINALNTNIQGMSSLIGQTF